MNPKTKILTAAAIVLTLGAVAGISGLGASAVARLALGGAALAALAWWYVKARHSGAAPGEKPRLEVIARAGLSQRAGLALVEVDGQPLLVVHGDGYAEIHRPRRLRPAKRASFGAALRSLS